MAAMDEADVRARIERHPLEGDAARMRDAFAALADLPADTADVSVGRDTRGGLDAVVVDARPGDGAGPTIVHLHGGGYVFGSPSTHLRLACTLARAGGALVHVPAYPLAPEHPWPAQRDATLGWLAALDAEDRLCGPLFLSGDSAGGHLALSLALAPPARWRRRLCGLALFSPNTLRDYARSESRRANAPRDAMNDPTQDDRLAAMAFGGTRADDLAQNPLDADLASLPALYVDVGGHEILLDDALLLARRAALAGVALELHVARGAFHMRQLFAQHWREADRSLERAGRWLRTLA